MSASMNDEKYRVVAPEAMHETFMSDSEEEGESSLIQNLKFTAFILLHISCIHKIAKKALCDISKKITQKHTCMLQIFDLI